MSKDKVTVEAWDEGEAVIVAPGFGPVGPCGMRRDLEPVQRWLEQGGLRELLAGPKISKPEAPIQNQILDAVDALNAVLDKAAKAGLRVDLDVRDSFVFGTGYLVYVEAKVFKHLRYSREQERDREVL